MFQTITPLKMLMENNSVRSIHIVCWCVVALESERVFAVLSSLMAVSTGALCLVFALCWTSDTVRSYSNTRSLLMANQALYPTMLLLLTMIPTGWYRHTALCAWSYVICFWVLVKVIFPWLHTTTEFLIFLSFLQDSSSLSAGLFSPTNI